MNRFRDVLAKLTFLISTHKFQSIFFKVRCQIIWLIAKLTQIHLQVDLKPDLHISALRQIKVSNTSTENIELSFAILSIFEMNYPWLQLHPRLIRHVVFKFTRLAQDHKGDALSSLAMREGALVKKLTLSHVFFILIVVRLREIAWTRLC